MKIAAIGLLTLILVSAGTALGQAPDCLEITGPATIQPPTGAESASKVKIVKVSGGNLVTVNNLEFTLVGGKWSLDAAKFNDILALTADPDRLAMTTGWFQGEQNVLASKRFHLPGEPLSVCQPMTLPPPKVVTPGVGTASTQDLHQEDCRPFLDDLVSKKRAKLGSDHFVVIIFKPTGELCIQSKPTATAGDLIYTAMVNDGDLKNANVQFTKCEAPTISPNNPEGETLPNKLQARQVVIDFPVHQCFGSSAEMMVKNKEISKPFTLALFNRFRFTLQVGLLASSQHSHSFGLRKDGSDMKIFDKGPSGSGPEYVATVILYGLPHYFGFDNPPKGGGDGDKDALASYFGRDPLHENGFADRLGLVLGAGLNTPGDRVVAGLSFELGFGINLIGVYEYAKLKDLVGITEGSTFTGTVEQIPTRDAWKGRWVGGVSIDMRYFTRLIKRSTS